MEHLLSDTVSKYVCGLLPLVSRKSCKSGGLASILKTRILKLWHLQRAERGWLQIEGSILPWLMEARGGGSCRWHHGRLWSFRSCSASCIQASFRPSILTSSACLMFSFQHLFLNLMLTFDVLNGLFSYCYINSILVGLHHPRELCLSFQLSLNTLQQRSGSEWER